MPDTCGSFDTYMGQFSGTGRGDGRQPPLAIAALEDKIVQRATVAVLNAIYEEDFLGFSYGFRPERGQHDALDALAVDIIRQRFAVRYQVGAVCGKSPRLRICAGGPVTVACGKT